MRDAETGGVMLSGARARGGKEGYAEGHDWCSGKTPGFVRRYRSRVVPFPLQPLPVNRTSSCSGNGQRSFQDEKRKTSERNKSTLYPSPRALPGQPAT